MKRTTEQDSRWDHLDKMSTAELLEGINTEDRGVTRAVQNAIPQIETLVDGIVERMQRGGRVFYTGAGTSGRLGVVDASEIPPTYGVKDAFIGLIAGGDGAIRQAVEGAEDDAAQGWNDILAFSPTPDDTVVGIAASGTTPYVLGAVRSARENGLLTGCITCNEDSPLADAAQFPVVAVVGPEFVTGSTRMKAGTATKLILNMISTSVMILLGHVKGSKMVDMELTNSKLVDRGARMIMDATGITDYEQARELLIMHGHVRAAVDAYLGKTE
ncbi:MAG: N-acetylmuramic acid 6-phosphate etherase [Bacteroidales bacterium]|nr:N-acetylmuramic acid 6-phosphate etherase [Bacteroidales bacterium]